MRTYEDLTTKEKLRLERSRLRLAKAQLAHTKVRDALGMIPTARQAVLAVTRRALSRLHSDPLP